MPLTVVTLVLEYECGACCRPVSATLRWEGKPDRTGPQIAQVGLACPHGDCRRVNELTFDQAGNLYGVNARPRRPGHVPVWN